MDKTTVFGELQGDVGQRPWRYVSEEGLKIHVGDDTVAGFSGHVGVAHALIRAYLDQRVSGSIPRNAVRDALISVTPSAEQAQVLFGFYEADTPRLLLADTATGSISDIDGLVQLGSDLSVEEHQWTERYVKGYLELLGRVGPDVRHLERIYAQLVALMQSYGIHNHLLQHGVGGAFVAAWLTPAGARWQGDHLYVVHGEMPASDDLQCATMIRDSVLCLVNNRTGANKIIARPLPSEKRADVEFRAGQAADKCVRAWDAGEFDYFISINTSKHVVTVIEMCRKHHHQFVSLHAPGFGDRLGIVWTAELVERANTIAGVSVPDSGHMTVYFQPFDAPSPDVQKQREQFAWENLVEQSSSGG